MYLYPQKHCEISKMSTILEAARQTLEPGDEVLHRYPANYKSSEGQLLLSNQKIIFVIRKGVFRPHYEPFIEIAYARARHDLSVVP